MPLEIRLKALSHADLPFVIQVFEEVLPLYRDLMPGTFEDNLATVIALQEQGADMTAVGLIARLILQQHEPVGFLAWAPLDRGPAYLASFYFLTDCRRKGYGTQALLQLELQLKYFHLPGMLLLVHRAAEWAVKFYLSQGYQILAEEPQAILAEAGEQIAHLLQPQMLLMGKFWAQSENPASGIRAGTETEKV